MLSPVTMAIHTLTFVLPYVVPNIKSALISHVSHLSRAHVLKLVDGS